ncbi:8-amino-7-oxononanoate synthase [Motilimonas cestriensis]|uniref:8-amino-7-oxononanoate synthase n=1 Tax=Motilimonas cestriensis TaxID=2742685 RepID=UPI003DA49DD6
MAFDFIKPALAQRQAEHLYRQLTPVAGAQGRYLEVGGQRYLNFSSNDYLSLAAEPTLINAWQSGLAQYGCGSGASALVTGYSQAHADLEAKLKSWLGVDAVALFNSGYSANQAILKLLLSKDDLLLQDKLNHASLMEAGSFLPCPMMRFRHNDMAHLTSLLTKSGQNKLIVSEGVFSMDGDSAPITELLQLRNQSQAWLMLDDAHGIGVCGPDGTGSAAAAGLKNSELDIYMATFGKALGVGGAMIAGSQSLIDYIINFSKPYIYTTAMPPAQAVAISKAVDLVETQSWRQQQLQDNIHYFKQLAGQYQLPLMASNSAIQPVVIGDSQQALDVANALRQQGFYCSAMRPPTVAKGTARLRITLTTAHQQQDIADLLASLNSILAAQYG